MNRSVTALNSFDPKKFLYRDFLSESDWANESITHNNSQMKPQELSREFRIKETRLSEGN